MSDETETMETLHCPNCGERGYSDAGASNGDIVECGNGNCSVFKFFHDANNDQ